MKKICIFLLIVSLICVCASACKVQNNKQSMVQAHRKFEKYVEPQSNTNKSAVDLSEGPRLNYDANLGPQNLNFDIKVVDPY